MMIFKHKVLTNSAPNLIQISSTNFKYNSQYFKLKKPTQVSCKTYSQLQTQGKSIKASKILTTKKIFNEVLKNPAKKENPRQANTNQTEFKYYLISNKLVQNSKRNKNTHKKKWKILLQIFRVQTRANSSQSIFNKVITENNFTILTQEKELIIMKKIQSQGTIESQPNYPTFQNYGNINKTKNYRIYYIDPIHNPNSSMQRTNDSANTDTSINVVSNEQNFSQNSYLKLPQFGTNPVFSEMNK
jgi:hypothetical protein